MNERHPIRRREYHIVSAEFDRAFGIPCILSKSSSPRPGDYRLHKSIVKSNTFSFDVCTCFAPEFQCVSIAAKLDSYFFENPRCVLFNEI